ncbi:hypothetical protein [Crocosphaera sp.]|uniref:hypothetical protein n=1 Tax=Crocosphaera sp. TaxID=2729996 RepID=UPI003F1EA251|nr:hypothetical protein [Crocosphaera sp.]
MSQNEDRGRKAAVEGIANEHIVVGLLMKRYQNVSLVDLPLSTYDIIIVRKFVISYCQQYNILPIIS